jgi:hypothetical protein
MRAALTYLPDNMAYRGMGFSAYFPNFEEIKAGLLPQQL